MKKALNGLWRIMSLRDKYLSLVIVSALFSTSVFSQAVDTTKILQNIEATGYNWKGGKFRSYLVIPSDTPKLKVADSGAVSYKGGSQWLWTGKLWKKSSGGGTTIFQSADSTYFTYTNETGGRDTVVFVSNSSGDTVYVKTTGIQNVYGKKTFLDTLKGIDLSNADSSLNIPPTRWVKRQLYAQKDAPLNPGSVPFANSSGILTQDATGLYYTGTILNIGTNNASVPSGLQLNGGRGTITADINGIQFRGGGATGTAYDATKHFQFFNGNISTPYLDIYSVGTGPYQHFAAFNTEISTTYSVTATQFKLNGLNSAPATATSTGTTGEIRFTATHVYFCTATNVWVRSALTTW